MLSLVALTCNRVRPDDWHGAHQLARSEGGYPAFAIAMHRRGRRGSLCWRVFFSLRTSSFPARRKSSSALSRAGNDQGLKTSTVQAPLFGHQAGVNGLIGKKSLVYFFCCGMMGTLRRAALQQEAGTVPRSCSLCTLHPCWHPFLLFRIAKSMTARACRCDSCVGKSCGVLVAFFFRQPA